MKNILLIVLVIIIAGTVGYFTFFKQKPLTESINELQPVENKQETTQQGTQGVIQRQETLGTFLFGRIAQAQVNIKTFSNNSEYEKYVEQVYRRSDIDGFVFKYPSGFTFFDSQSSPDSWVIIKWREGRVAKPIDCGGFLMGPDEISFSWSIFDRQKREFEGVIEAIDKRYNSSKYTSIKIGDKSLKVQRSIPGMCENGDEFIWMEPSGRYIVLFNIRPSNTNLVNEYNMIIESFKFL